MDNATTTSDNDDIFLYPQNSTENSYRSASYLNSPNSLEHLKINNISPSSNNKALINS